MPRTPDVAAPASTATATASAPRLAVLWAALAYAFSTLALGFPALAGMFLVNPRSDQYIAGYAFRDFAARYFREHGAIPQWNPYLFGGMPFVDAMHGDTFYPTALLRALLGTDVGMTWGFMVHVFLAGLFSYLFLRSIGLSFFASLVGGVAYQMGGNVAGLVSPGHDGKLFIAALLPLALLLVVRGVRDGKRFSWGVLAIVIGLAVLSPHPQLLQYMLLMTGAFALFMAMGWGSDELLPRRRGMTRLAFALGSVGLGMVMGAIQYWPVKTYEPFSPRAGGKDWAHAISYSMPPEETLNFAVPQFSGILDSYWGQNGIHFHADYVGITTLMLAGLAFGAWALGSQKRLVRFWLVSFIISLLWAMGGFTPFYALVYAVVPGTKYFRAPSTMLYVVSFCLAVLAAFGAERALRGGVRPRYVIGWGIAALLIGLLGATGMLTNLAVALALPERLDAVMANDGALKVGALRSMVFALLLLAALWMISARRLSRDLSGILLALVVATDLWTVLRSYWIFMEPASVSFASNPVIDYLKQQPQPFRVLPNQTAPSEVWRDPTLRYDGLMVHDIAQVLGYHGNQLSSYDRLAGSEEGYRQLGNPNFWRLANMRYILTNSPDSMGIPGLRTVAGPAKDAAGNDLYLHQLPVETHYAWVTPVIVKADEASILNTVLDSRFDVTRAALFDSSVQVEGKSVQALPPPLDISANVTSYQAGKVSISLDKPAPEGSALMVSENWYPGWTATVDGAPAVLGKADVTFIGVALPAGARKIELTFESVSYETGKRVTIFAILLALLATAAGYLVDRRRITSV
ncbi:MAG: hypothetical protein ABIZ91_10595 [Gemmatimonadaceae bacterium]